MNTESLDVLQRAGAGLASRFRPNHRPSASVFRTLAECTVKCEFRKFKQDLGWCLDDDVNQKYAFLGTKCEQSSCGVEGPPCQAPAESDDDDCVDDEDWSYTTKEGDEYDCDHVAKKTKRCTTRFSEDGVRADDACKKTCGTC